MNFFNHTQFIGYIRKNDLTSVKNLLEDGETKGFDVNTQLAHNRHDGLRVASEYGHIEIVKLLLNYGKPTQERYETSLRVAAMFNQVILVKSIVEEMEEFIDIKEECAFALKVSAEYGNLDCIEYLISKGFDQEILRNIHNETTKKYLLKLDLEKDLIHDNYHSLRPKL